jgi:hypothetical protein
VSERGNWFKSLIILSLLGFNAILAPLLLHLQQIILLISIYAFYLLYHNKTMSVKVIKIDSISILTILLISFFFPVSNETRWIVIGLFSMVYLFGSNSKSQVISYPLYKPFSIYLLILLVFNVFIKKIEYVVQFLSYGYDNAFHLMVYRGFIETSWFPLNYLPEWWSDFGLFKSTPIGSSALFSAFSSIFLSGENEMASATSAFLLINLMIICAICLISIRIILQSDLNFSSRFQKSCLAVGIISTVLLTSGTLLVNGFPPYNFAVLIILLVLRSTQNTQGLKPKLLTLTSGVFCLILITPAPSAFLILPASILFFQFISTKILAREYLEILKVTLIIIFLASISLFSFTSSSANLGWRQLLAPGGVSKPNIQMSVFLLLMSFILLMLKFFRNRIEFIDVYFISGTLSLLILSLINIIFTGQIQYYAIKQFYVWAILAAILLYRWLFSFRFGNSERYKSFAIFVCGFLPLCMVLGGITKSNGFMQGLPNAFYALVEAEKSTGYVVNGWNQVKIANNVEIPPKTCVLYREENNESDLNSRWANALKSDMYMPEKCFGLYWNSSVLDLLQIEFLAEQAGIGYFIINAGNR